MRHLPNMAGVNSPHRHVRTRLYFTSESHMHSLMNVLRYGGCTDANGATEGERRDDVGERRGSAPPPAAAPPSGSDVAAAPRAAPRAAPSSAPTESATESHDAAESTPEPEPTPEPTPDAAPRSPPGPSEQHDPYDPEHPRRLRSIFSDEARAQIDDLELSYAEITPSSRPRSRRDHGRDHAGLLISPDLP